MADDQDVEVNRVRELEAMVKKLTVENKRLLTKVDTSIVKTNSQEESDEDTSLLGGEMSADVEDEWLYVSPVKPPTKEQKRLTPQQWLEDGGGINKGGLSLKEAQQVLTFTLEEEEKFCNTNARVGKRLQPSNKTAQKYLNHVRQKRSSLSDSEENSSDRHSPLKEEIITEPRRPAHNNIVKPVIPQGKVSANNDSESVEQPSLKVKWTPKAYSDSDEEEQESLPDSTEGKNTPALEEPEPSTLSLKVKWDPSKATVSSSEGEDEEEAPPTRVWKVKQVPDHSSSKVPQVPLSPVEQKKRATVQRSGTFTKIDRKMVKPQVGESALRVKWTPKNVQNASSSEEDISQRANEGEMTEDEPSFTSYPTLTRPAKKNTHSNTPTSRQSPVQAISPQRGLSPVLTTPPSQRGLSPVYHGTSSPLQFNRKSSLEGMGKTSRSPSPGPGPSIRSPSTSSLRPPSPRRISDQSASQNIQQQATPPPRRQLPSPSRLKSPGQHMKPATTQGTRLQTPGQRTSLPGGGQGLRTPSSLTPPKAGGKGQISPSSSLGGVRRQGVPMAKSPRGGIRQPAPVRSSPRSSNPPTNEDGWLDGCY